MNNYSTYNNWIIISFFTSNYKEIAEKYLLNSLKIQGLPNYVKEVPNFNSWKQATDYKPVLMAKCLNKFWQNLIWIDCDATIDNYPELFDTLSNNPEIDIAYHNLSWETHYGRPTDKGRFQFASGTLYFKNNDKIKQLVINWINNTKIYYPEQKALHKAIISNKNLNTFELPRTYLYIATKPNGQPPAQILENPIITHYQASRKK